MKTTDYIDEEVLRILMNKLEMTYLDNLYSERDRKMLEILVKRKANMSPDFKYIHQDAYFLLDTLLTMSKEQVDEYIRRTT